MFYTFEGKGDYSGTRYESVLATLSLNSPSVTVSDISDVLYTGDPLKPGVTVKVGDLELKAGEDYYLIYDNNVEVGTASVTLKGMPHSSDRFSYVTGEVTKTFRIVDGTVSEDGVFSGTTKSDGRASSYGFEADGSSAVKVTVDGSSEAAQDVTNGIAGEVTLSVIDSDGKIARYNGETSGDELVTAGSLGGENGALELGCGVLPKGQYYVEVKSAASVTGVAFSGNVEFKSVEPEPEPDPVADTVTMHRLYNPYTGEHLYTASTGERDSLASIGWKYEGVGWTAPKESSTPVYRLYNPYVAGGDHHYTTSKEEYDKLAEAGWKQEGVAWFSDDAKGVPLYRQYNPYAATGTHNYTTSKAENDALVKLGWRAEGVGWYGVK